jgi:NDP-sugar pyrophosphorylase family protein
MKAVILAGGKGTRLEPYTAVFPKPLMPIGEMPVLEVVLRQLVSSGFTDITLAVGHLAELIEAYCGDGSRWGMTLTYAREREPLGTAGPIANLLDVSDPFLVMNGDVLSTLDYGAFLKGHVDSGADLSIATHRRTSTIDFGIVEADGERITGYVEKPQSEHLVSMGVYAFSPDVIEHIPVGEHFDLPDLVLGLIDEDAHLRSVPFDGYWLDIGRAEDFAQAQLDFEANKHMFLGDGA